MRVLQAMAGAPYGGAEAFFVRLVPGLAAAGLDQEAVIRSHATRAAALRGAGVAVTELPFGGLLDLRTRPGLHRVLRQARPDVVMTWMNRATRFCPPARGRFVHVARLGGYYDLKYYRHCDHLVGNTEDIVRYLVKQGWPAERAHYLPNFVHAPRGAVPQPRGPLYTPERAPLLLALGRFHRNKAFDTLLRALARVPDACLWLAGDGPERAALEELALELAIKPRVRFLGWREDVGALMAAADLFVVPSRHEPLGNVVVEAWAHGRPVVATDSEGPGTLIAHGESGLLAPVDEPAALADTLRWALSDPELMARIAAGGQETYAEHYTEDAVVARYMDFFRQVAG